jgi:hypothetical protein
VGFARWVLNQDKVAAQVRERDDVSLFFNPLRDGIAGSLRGGYNVFGHGHIGFNFLATGWDITNSSRGGGGYIGGEIGWHPISLAELFLKDGLLKDKWYDFWLETGCGYGIVGKDRAMDGLVASFGLGTEGFPAPWVSIGLRITWYFPFFGRYIRDYDNRDLPGNTIDLPDKSGGKFFALTGHINFHFGAP